jgi:hypothetical protein
VGKQNYATQKPSIWSGMRPQIIYKGNETDCLYSKKDRSQVDNISRQYPSHEPIRGSTVERQILFVTPSSISGMVNKLDKNQS